jgi:hypothetical protein
MTILANTGASMSPRKITTPKPATNSKARMTPSGSEKYRFIQRLMISIMKRFAPLA